MNSDILTLISSYNYNNKTNVYIVYGDFKQWGGNINIGKLKFKRLMKVLEEECESPVLNTVKSYQYHNMRKIFISNSNYSKLVTDHNVKNIMLDQFIVSFWKQNQPYNDTFPTVKQYHNISEENVVEFQMCRSFIIQLSEEFYSKKQADYVYSVTLKVIDVHNLYRDSVHLKKVHSLILKEIS